jgi:two-component system nitrogen regulation response regulator NtrX
VEDIPELVAYFLREALAVNGIAPPPLVGPEAMQLLKDHDWPGNVRQLKNMVQRLLVLNNGPVIGPELVASALAADHPGMATDSGNGGGGQNDWADLKDLSFNDAKDEFERQFILQKLRENQYNVSKTAQSLGMYPSNLHAKIKKFNISTER